MADARELVGHAVRVGVHALLIGLTVVLFRLYIREVSRRYELLRRGVDLWWRERQDSVDRSETRRRESDGGDG